MGDSSGGARWLSVGSLGQSGQWTPRQSLGDRSARQWDARVVESGLSVNTNMQARAQDFARLMRAYKPPPQAYLTMGPQLPPWQSK